MENSDNMLREDVPAEGACPCVDVDAVIGTGAAEGSGAEPVNAAIDDSSAQVTQSARAQALADAEEAARRAEEAAAFREAEAREAERRAGAAVEQLGAAAGFVTRAGVYYDVRAAKRAAATAAEAADMAANATRAARALKDANQSTTDNQALTLRLTCDDNTSTSPADPLDPEFVADDLAEEGSYVDAAAFARQVARLTETVARQPLHREILYKTLVFCEESRPLRQVEEQVASYPEFAHAANNPYHFIQTLEQAGGLERFDLDEEGEVVTPDRKAGLTEDEVDDLVADYAFMTTPAGLAVVEQHAPRSRIIELLGLVPERKDTYVELLDFCSEEPRTYNEICQLLRGRPALVRLVDGEPQTMQPSVFVDKMEAAGGMEWVDGGWILTPEGRDYLAELRG